ncbi:MAG: tannase/feruloyl esterase family alpha/beta hydrolase [Gammaproteobacteria bacterium]|nr:tannase/feruloyl esterase family alpha/beta hydrolase [Gammaproteobacteria bacterium]
MNNNSKIPKRLSKAYTIFLSAALAAFMLQAMPAAAQVAVINARACAALPGETINGVNVTTTEWLELDSVADPVCVVSGFRAPYLDLEVVLPSEWSGRYVQQGGGGFDGFIPSALQRNPQGEVVGLNEAVARFNSVHAASNGGNRAGVDGESAPGVWLSGGPGAEQSLMDYSFLAGKVVLDFAHGLTEEVYGQLPEYGYFNGCSNGGRNAYIAAQRWPEHFDGVVSGCEPMNMPGTTTAWLSLAGVQGTPAALTETEYTFAFNSAVAACDADDGKVDGVIGNPSACSFSPRELICEASEMGQCLSSEQASTLELLLTDTVDNNGNILSSRFYWADFGPFGPSFGGLGGVYGWIATGDVAWVQPAQQQQFNSDMHHYEIANGLHRAGIGHDRYSVAEFVASGKKLISWHDGSDNLLSPGDHVRVFGELTSTIETLANDSAFATDEHARLFIVPGTGHGGGAMTVNWIEAIIDWTENGNAPQSLIYEGRDGSTMPVCRYPAYTQGTRTGYTCSDL